MMMHQNVQGSGKDRGLGCWVVGASHRSCLDSEQIHRSIFSSRYESSRIFLVAEKPVSHVKQKKGQMAVGAPLFGNGFSSTLVIFCTILVLLSPLPGALALLVRGIGKKKNGGEDGEKELTQLRQQVQDDEKKLAQLRQQVQMLIGELGKPSPAEVPH
jgi:Sec-independent protein translocase protein TatA